VPAEHDPAVRAEHESPLAVRVWWTRAHRAAERKGLIGSKVMSDWCHDLLPVLSAGPERLELVGPFGQRTWQPIPPERCTEEYMQRETRRLCDELGRKLGVGPMP
jgi:hypothetical protein